jgi:hypothetical protein
MSLVYLNSHLKAERAGRTGMLRVLSDHRQLHRSKVREKAERTGREAQKKSPII